MTNMRNMVDYYPHFVVITFDSYLYYWDKTGVVRLRDKYVEAGIKRGVPIVVRGPSGEVILLGRIIKKMCKKVKEEFLIPGNPMTLYEIRVPDRDKKPIETYMF